MSTHAFLLRLGHPVRPSASSCTTRRRSPGGYRGDLIMGVAIPVLVLVIMGVIPGANKPLEGIRRPHRLQHVLPGSHVAYSLGLLALIFYAHAPG